MSPDRIELACLPAGTRLYHGTRSAGDFALPDGPAWFAFDADTAAGWASWRSTPPAGRRFTGPPRVIAGRTRRDLLLLDTRTRAQWQALGIALLNDDEPLMEELARTLARTGAPGWLGGREVLLSTPATSLAPDASRALA